MLCHVKSNKRLGMVIHAYNTSHSEVEIMRIKLEVSWAKYLNEYARCGGSHLLL
jgi:hypothetical protein